jgi:hypothetical protein
MKRLMMWAAVLGGATLGGVVIARAVQRGRVQMLTDPTTGV